MHPITTINNLDSKLASHTLLIIEYTSYPQGIAYYMSKCKSNANRAILILKTTNCKVYQLGITSQRNYAVNTTVVNLT